MNLLSIFNKREDLLALDIGTGAIKMVEIENVANKLTLVSFAVQPLEPELFANNLISKPEIVAEAISKLCEANQIEGKRVIASLPAPAVFTKRIKMPKQDDDELRNSIQFEAANFIPHKIDAVKLDYAILGETGKNQLDVLVVAVKNELLESLEDCLAIAGLECAIADVDFFASHNVLQFNQPPISGTQNKESGDGSAEKPETYALLTIGYRYTSVAISQLGLPLFVGDVSIGLKQLEEDLAIKLSIPEAQGRNAIISLSFNPEWEPVVNAFVDQAAQELSRQLSFFWNTCGAEGSINKVLVSGVGALMPKLIEAIGRKSGYETSLLNPFLNIAIGDRVDKQYLEKVSPLLTVAVGLGLRYPGDRAV